MLAIQSGIEKYHCLYAQGAVASHTPGVFFDSPGIIFDRKKGLILLLSMLRFKMALLKKLSI